MSGQQYYLSTNYSTMDNLSRDNYALHVKVETLEKELSQSRAAMESCSGIATELHALAEEARLKLMSRAMALSLKYRTHEEWLAAPSYAKAVEWLAKFRSISTLATELQTTTSKSTSLAGTRHEQAVPASAGCTRGTARLCTPST